MSSFMVVVRLKFSACFCPELLKVGLLLSLRQLACSFFEGSGGPYLLPLLQKRLEVPTLQMKSFSTAN